MSLRHGESRAVMGAMETTDDEGELVARTMRGDEASFNALYARHAAAAYAAAHRLLGSTADAEDVIQELFLALPTTLVGYDVARGSLGSWLRRVAVRLALMRMRAVRRRREVDAGSVTALLARTEDLHGRLSLEAALGRLAEEQRIVFVLKEIEGYAHREIAVLLDISVANSEIRLFRARQSLRALLGDSR